MDSATKCAEHLSELGKAEYNLSVGESMSLNLSEWVNGKEICNILSRLPDRSIFGDVYARFVC